MPRAFRKWKREISRFTIGHAWPLSKTGNRLGVTGRQTRVPELLGPSLQVTSAVLGPKSPTLSGPWLRFPPAPSHFLGLGGRFSPQGPRTPRMLLLVLRGKPERFLEAILAFRKLWQSHKVPFGIWGSNWASYPAQPEVAGSWMNGESWRGGAEEIGWERWALGRGCVGRDVTW